MKPRSTPIESPKIAKVRRELGRWRESHTRGSRISEALWASAAELARKHGLNRIARALRLDYYSLKKRLERAPSPAQARRERPASFVEIALPGAGKSPECIVELEHPSGMKMRVALKGTPDVAEFEAVASALWRAAQ